MYKKKTAVNWILNYNCIHIIYFTPLIKYTHTHIHIKMLDFYRKFNECLHTKVKIYFINCLKNYSIDVTFSVCAFFFLFSKILFLWECVRKRLLKKKKTTKQKRYKCHVCVNVYL